MKYVLEKTKYTFETPSLKERPTLAYPRELPVASIPSPILWAGGWISRVLNDCKGKFLFNELCIGKDKVFVETPSLKEHDYTESILFWKC